MLKFRHYTVAVHDLDASVENYKAPIRHGAYRREGA